MYGEWPSCHNLLKCAQSIEGCVCVGGGLLAHCVCVCLCVCVCRWTPLVRASNTVCVCVCVCVCVQVDTFAW